MGDDPYSIPEREMKDFQFRQMKKIRVFGSPDDLPKERSSLLAISNKYGLTFVGQGRTLKMFLTQNIILAAKEEGNTNDIVENVKCQVVNVDLPIHHLALSSDELTLSVCGVSEETPLTLDFYDVRTFFNSARQEKKPFASFKPDTVQDTSVQDLKWSPVEAFRLAVCLSDGGMMVLDVTNSVSLVAQLPDSVGITCVCWSPKGKQVAAGKQDATVVQYTPALQEKKVIPCPNFYSSDNPVKVLDVLWLSTFNFAVAYAAADGSPETPPELVVVSLPKKDEKREEKYLNFNDLVYGTCTERQHHYFLSHIEDWDLVLAASAASIEVSIIAKQDDKSIALVTTQTNWELWVLEDASRGELPVTLNNDDTLPVGVAIDYTSQGEIYISDEKKLPPAPTLLILSTDGVLCPFSLLNLNPGVKQLVTDAGALPADGERPPLTKSSAAPPAQVPAVSSLPSVFPSFQMPSTTAQPAAPSAVPSALPAAPPSSSSFSHSFSLPPLVPTGAMPFNSSKFSFTAPKPSSDVPSASTFSFSAAAIKPPSEASSQRAATASPITVLKPPETATPNVRMNLTDRFLAAETPAPPALATQPFSLTSTPKPALNSSIQPTPQFSISKPAVVAVTRPAQPSIPSAQKTVTPTAPSAAPAAQTLSVKTLEKQLQQKKDSDPVLAGILEEIAHFQKEMDELKARSNRADFCVGSSEEKRDLRKESEDLLAFTLEIKETTESLHGDISALKTTLLEGFAGVEEARAQKELNRDKGYLQLLYKKPLDPRSEEQLKEIRKLYQYVKFAVEDVNDVLDLEWERHLEEKKKKQKHMIVPEREALYTALANNMDIINQQKQKLDQLVRDLQSLRLYNKTSSWTAPSHPESTVSSRGLDSELESLRNALLKASLETAPKAPPSKSPSKMTPLKQSQLRNFLSKRQTPPVRSTAPANLSRSAFLSPKYYEDLDDVSSTSSMSQPLEPDDSLAVAEEDEELLPVPALTPRHPTVARTASIQPGFPMQSTPFSRVQPGPGPIGSPMLPKISMDSGESSKTVKHVPLSTMKTMPTTIPAPEAAARAALNRQMISQKTHSVTLQSTSLTESTLKTVPQVVNVQQLKEKVPAVPVSTVISSSVPAPAAQVVQQVLATVEAKKNSSQAGVKVTPSVTESTPSPQTFVFAPKADPASTSAPSLKQPNSKAFTFSTVSPVFSFSQNSTPSPSQGAASSQAAPGTVIFSQPAVSTNGAASSANRFTPVSSSATEAASSTTTTPFTASTSAIASTTGKEPGPANKFSFISNSAKIVFAPSETPFSFSPATAPLPNKTEPVKLTTTPPLQPTKAQAVPGETLGLFSDLRVGQADEVKEPSKSATNFTFGSETAATFTFSSQPKPTASGPDSSSSSTDVPRSSAPIGLPAASSIFKPPVFSAPSTTKPASSSPTSFSSLLAAPLPSEAATEQPPAASAPPEPPTASATTPEESPSEPSPEPPAQSTPSPVSISEEPGLTPSQPLAPTGAPTQAAPTLSVTPTLPSSVTPPAEPTAVAEATVPEAKPAPTPTASYANLEQPSAAPLPAAVIAAAAPVPPSTTPGSIFAQPIATSTGTTLSVTSFTPVISTATIAAPSSTTVTPLASSTTAQPPAPIFGQPAITTSAPTFGSSTFGAASTSSGFGKPVFGQVSTGGFGQPTAAAGSASGFTFGQSTFGTGSGSGFGQTPNAAGSAPSSSAGGLFGSSNTSSANSFSFGVSSTSSGGSGGTNIFGQSSAPVFGQQQGSGFGQGSLFGSNTTTTTSSGFGFGQPAAFGSTSTSSVFGQQPGGGSVFGQSSSGTALFGSSTGNVPSGGGGFFSGLGGKPSEDAVNKNPFGTTTTGGFGQTNQAGSTSLFGNSGAKAFGFGTAGFGEQKPAGTFTAGGGSVAAQGFGSFSTPTKLGGFGSAPVFGSPPAFGGSPAFGGNAAFGANPNFNNPMASSPGKVFGEGTAAASVGGFGFASPQSAPSFGALAQQSSTPSFGGLTPQNPGFGGQSSFSAFGSSGGFGGFGNTNPNQSASQTFGGWRS